MTTAQALIQRIATRWAPPVRRSIAEWAEAKRYLGDGTSPFPGRFRLSLTPFLREVLDELSNPETFEVVAQKSAQIGWTDGVLCNWLGQIVDEDPAPTIVLFPSDKKGKEFNGEKFEPMVDATPVLAEALITKSRAKENRLDWKVFAGGFLKFVGSNSPANVKSTTAKNLAVEEPDDCNLNIKGQGDSITMLEERGKRYPGRKLLVGGTPSISGVSAIEARMRISDQRSWHVPCHHCGEAAPLAWKNVRWSKQAGRNHEVFGDELPETARYYCASCGGEWSDAEKITNVQRGWWKAAGEFRGRAGFYFNELMSVFADARLGVLAEKYLIAKHAMEIEGDISKMIVFRNQTEGLSWEYKGTTADPKDLAQRVDDYPEWFVPWGGLIITVGVDVQHDRLAAVVRAWGEGEESWLVYAGEFYGNVLETGVWDELDRAVVFRAYQHVSGAALNVSAVSVDSSDGQTADAVYAYARRANQKFGVARVMPIKGSSKTDSEIFRAPGKPLDVTADHKGAKYGLRPYIVGVSRAKDLLLGADEQAGRVNLVDPTTSKTGRGPGRVHWYRGVRADYFDQLTAEVKVPATRGSRSTKVWQKKAGKANEFLDCEIYALHAGRALRIDTYSSARWKELHQQILQANLFAIAEREHRDREIAAPAEQLEAAPARDTPRADTGWRSNQDAATEPPARKTAPMPVALSERLVPAPRVRRQRSAGVTI